MNVSIFAVGLKRYAIAAANLEIAERRLGMVHTGFRTIPVRDMLKSLKRKYAPVIADPETVYLLNENTNEWEMLNNA